MSTLQGKLRQKKEKGGQYYYRLAVAPGVRKEFSLKTADYNVACQKAEELDALWLAPTPEVAMAQINAIRGFSRSASKLLFADAWEKYQVHPDRATPHTVAEQQSYQRTYEEFVRFAIGGKTMKRGSRCAAVSCINEVTPKLCEEFSAYLKTTMLAVDTHNRKIKRLRKIFDCLKDYYDGDNPFRSKTLLRSEREEQGSVVHRQAFTKEQEEQLLAVLSDSDPRHKLINKAEIRIVYIIGMFTGQRLKDCVLLQWQNIDMKNRRIWVKQFKTGKEVTIPIAPELYDALTEAEEWRCDQYVTPKSAARYNVTAADGKNVGNNLIDIDVMRPIRWIGLEPSVEVPGRKRKMTVYGFHSLRHSFASFCAEAGVPKATLLSILGTDSDIADKYYTHVSDESQRKAIEVISNRSSTTAQERNNRALRLIEENQSLVDPTTLLQQVYTVLKGN
jgi:integrase